MKPHTAIPETPQRRTTSRVQCRKTIENYLRAKYPDSAFHSLHFLIDSGREGDVAAKSRASKINSGKRDLAVAEGNHCGSLAGSESGDLRCSGLQHQAVINEKDADLKTPRARRIRNPRNTCDSTNPATYTGSKSSTEKIPKEVRISDVGIKGGRERARKCTAQNSNHSSFPKPANSDKYSSTSKMLLNLMIENSRKVSSNERLGIETPYKTGSSDIVHIDYNNTIFEKSLFNCCPVVKVNRLEDELIGQLEQYGFVSVSRAMSVMDHTPSLAEAPTEISVRPCESLEVSECSYSNNYIKPLSEFGSPEKESYIKYATSHGCARSNHHVGSRKVNLSSKNDFSDINSGFQVAEDVHIDCNKSSEVRLSGQCPETENIRNEHSTKTTLKSTPRRRSKSLSCIRSPKPQAVRRSEHSFIRSKSLAVVGNIEQADDTAKILGSDGGQNDFPYQVFQLVPGHRVSAFQNNRWAVEGSRNQYISRPSSNSISSDSANESLVQSLTKKELGALCKKSLKRESPDICFISKETKHHSHSDIESHLLPGETKLDALLNGDDLTQKLDSSSEKQRSSSTVTVTLCGDESLPDCSSSKQVKFSTNEESSFCSDENTLLGRMNPMPAVDSEVELTKYGCDGVEGTSVLTGQEDGFCLKSPTEVVEGNSSDIFLSDKDEGVSEQLKLLSANPSHDTLNQLSCTVSPSNVNNFVIQKDIVIREDPVRLRDCSLEMETFEKSVDDTGSYESMNKELNFVIGSDIGDSNGNITASKGQEGQSPLSVPEVLDSKLPPIEGFIDLCRASNLEQNSQIIPEDELGPIQSLSVASSIENIGVFVKGRGKDIYVDDVLAPHQPPNQDDHKPSNDDMTNQTEVVKEALDKPLYHIDAPNYENGIKPVESHALPDKSAENSNISSTVEEPKKQLQPYAPELPVEESFLQGESIKSCNELSSLQEELTGFTPVLEPVASHCAPLTDSAEKLIMLIDSSKCADVVISEATPELLLQPAPLVFSENNQESFSRPSSYNSEPPAGEEGGDVENHPPSLSVPSENVDECPTSRTFCNGPSYSLIIQTDYKGDRKLLSDETTRNLRSKSLNKPDCDESQAFPVAESVGTEDLGGYQVSLNGNNTNKTEFWNALEQNKSSSVDIVDVTRLLDEVNHDISFTQSTQPTLNGMSHKVILGETSPVTQAEPAEKQDLPVKDCEVSFKQVPENEEYAFKELLSAENSFPSYSCKSAEIPSVLTTSRDSVCPSSCGLPYQWQNDVRDETFRCSEDIRNDSSEARTSAEQMSLGFNILGENLITENVRKITPSLAQKENEPVITDHHSSDSIETRVGDILENVTDIGNHLVISNRAEFPNDENIFDGKNTIFSENTSKFFSGESLVGTNDDYHESDKTCSQVTQPPGFLDMSDYTEDLVDACLRENLPEPPDCLSSVHVVKSADVSLMPGPSNVLGETATNSGHQNKTGGAVDVSKELANECLNLPHLPAEDLGDKSELNSPNASSRSTELIVDGFFCETDEPIYLPTAGGLKTVWCQNSSKSEDIQSTLRHDAQHNNISFMDTTNQQRVVNIKCQLDVNQLDVKTSLDPTQPSSSQGIVTELSEEPVEEERNRFENGPIPQKKQLVNVESDIGSEVNDLLFDEEFERSNNVSPIKRTRVIKIVSPVTSAVVGPQSSKLLYNEEFELSNNSLPMKKIKVGPSVTISRVCRRTSPELLFDEEFEQSNNITPVKRMIGGKGQLQQASPQTVRVTSEGLVDDLVIDENDEAPLNAAQESVNDNNERLRSRKSSVGCLVISSDEESESPQISNYPGLAGSSSTKPVKRPTIRVLSYTKSSPQCLQTSRKTKRDFVMMGSPRIVKLRDHNPPLKQIVDNPPSPEQMSYIDLSVDTANESAYSPPSKISKICVSSDEETTLYKLKELAYKISYSEGSHEGNHCIQGTGEISTKPLLAVRSPVEQNEANLVNLVVDPNLLNEPHNAPEISVIASDKVTHGYEDVIELTDSDTDQAPGSITVDPTHSILYSDSDLSTGFLDEFIDSDGSFSPKKDDSVKPENSSAPKPPLSTQRQNFIKNYSQQLVELAETLYERKRASSSLTSSLKSQPLQNATSLTSSRAQSPESLSDRDFMDSEDSSWSDAENTATSPHGPLSKNIFSTIKTATALQNSEGPALKPKEGAPASRRPLLKTSVHSKTDFISSSDEDDNPSRSVPPKRSSAPLVPRQSVVVTKTTEASKNKTLPTSSSSFGGNPSICRGIPLDDRGNCGSGLNKMTLISPSGSSTQVMSPLNKLTVVTAKGSVNSSVKSSFLSCGKANVISCQGEIDSVPSTVMRGPSRQCQNLSRKRVSTSLKRKKRSHDTPAVTNPLSATSVDSNRLRSSLHDDDVSSLTVDESSSSGGERGAKSYNAAESDCLSSKLVLSRQSLNFIKSVTQQPKSPNCASGMSRPLGTRIPSKSPLAISKVHCGRRVSKPPLANKHS